MGSRMELALSKALLYGVLSSTGIIIIGLLLLVLTNSTGYSCDGSGDTLSCILAYNAKDSFQLYPTSLDLIASGLLSAKPFAVIQLGVIVLLATPVVRVSTSLVLFLAERDRQFVLITLFVLGVLMFSFFIVPLLPIFQA